MYIFSPPPPPPLEKNRLIVKITHSSVANECCYTCYLSKQTLISIPQLTFSHLLFYVSVNHLIICLLSVCLSMLPSVSLSDCPSVWLSVCLPVCMSDCLPDYLPFCLPEHCVRVYESALAFCLRRVCTRALWWPQASSVETWSQTEPRHNPKCSWLEQCTSVCNSFHNTWTEIIEEMKNRRHELMWKLRTKLFLHKYVTNYVTTSRQCMMSQKKQYGNICSNKCRTI